MSEQSLDKLIGTLTDELKAVKPLAHPLKRAWPWIVVSIVYVALAGLLHGFRHDMSAKLADMDFMFEVLLMGFVSVSAVLASLWLCVPDMRGQKWLAAIPVTLFGVFVLWTCLRCAHEGLTSENIHWTHCFEAGILMGFIPVFALLRMMRAGTTTHPRLLALMNMLAVAGLGYVGLRLTCGMDTVAHATLFHISPFLLAGAVLGFLSRKIYRW
jgi:hypothetical protein